MDFDTEKESMYGYVKGVSGPVVIAKQMAGAAVRVGAPGTHRAGGGDHPTGGRPGSFRCTRRPQV